MMVNNNLVGGFNHLLNMKVNGKKISHILWKTKNVPNQQPGYHPNVNPHIFKKWLNHRLNSGLVHP